MSYTDFDDLDAAELRRERREAARAAVRGIPIPEDPEPAAPAASAGRPASDPAQAAPIARPTAVAAPQSDLTDDCPYELLDELPAGRMGRTPPQVRQRAIDVAIDNPGLWVKYVPSTGDPFKSASTLVNQARRAIAGFPPGFAASKTVAKVAYLQYNPEDRNAE